MKKERIAAKRQRRDYGIVINNLESKINLYPECEQGTLFKKLMKKDIATTTVNIIDSDCFGQLSHNAQQIAMQISKDYYGEKLDRVLATKM